MAKMIDFPFIVLQCPNQENCDKNILMIITETNITPEHNDSKDP